MHLSVVIPTFNRERLLPRTIPALMNQEGEGFTYEVVFVINGSTDASESILSEAVSRYEGRLRFFRLPPTGGPSAPRNKGIREANGEVVIILDDDVIPDRGLVAAHARYHRSHAAEHEAAVGELYVPEELRGDPMTIFHEFPYHEFRGKETLAYYYFWTCNVSIKRSFMLKHGMFDEEFLGYEDMICGHQLHRAGMVLRFCPEARGQHLHQLKAAGVAAKGFWYGRWLYALIQKLPEREMLIRFGILSPKIGWGLLAKRLVMRAAFQIVNTPLTRASLRLAGAEGGKRTRISDFYYFLVFRGNMLSGYAEAKRAARRAGVDAVLDFEGSHAGQGDTIPPER